MSKKVKMNIGYESIDVDAETAQFLKILTGKEDYSSACDHFVITCLEFFLKPKDVLKGIQPKVNPLIVDDYLGEDNG